jgi:ubiquitin-protein ligase
MSSKKLLLNQLVSMKKNPVWGISCELPDESDVFKWDVYIEGKEDLKLIQKVLQVRFKIFLTFRDTI